MKRRVAVLLILAAAETVLAQGVEAPHVTSFRPDTSLPKVNVPEFVITGKAQTDVARFYKKSTEIDSSYFQDKTLAGLSMEVPMDRSLSMQTPANQRVSLFARLSTGSYATTTYLLSGGGDVGPARLNASLNGDYTSGFTSQTIQRGFSVQAGISKDMMLDESAKTSNAAEVRYSRASYFLYGTGITDLLRTMDQLNLGLQSDMDFVNFPLAAGLSFDRFSIDDYWKDTQSTIDLSATGILQLSPGSLTFDGSFRFGNHTTTPPSFLSPTLSQINRSSYGLKLGGLYSNRVGGFSYSLGLKYFQYSDDYSRGIGKIYPDLHGAYRINDQVSLYSSFLGEVGNSTLSTIFDRNRYLVASFPLRNTQEYANFTMGGDWAVNDDVSISPQFNIDASRFYPIFATFPFALIGDGTSRADTSRADNELLYADRATIFTTSLTARYKKDKWTADATLDLRNGTADSLTSIPNLAPFDMTVGADYKVNPQFVIRAYITILSSRFSDLALKNKVGSIWLLNFHLAYDLQIGRIPVEIFASGKNILDQKYFVWQGYQEFPIGLFIGISSKIL